MKYLITESKLKDAMWSFFDEYINVDTVAEFPATHEDNNGVIWDDDSATVYYDTWDREPEGELFRYYTCKYFDEPPEICPIVDVSVSLHRTFESVFPEIWKKPFMEWVEKKFDIKVNGIY